jgi:hypothetical protein
MSMICSCVCGCFILEPACLYQQNSRLKAFKVAEKPEILDAVNTFILIGKANDGILGYTCFNELCTAIKQAQAQADEYAEANPNRQRNDPMAEYMYYMPDNWKMLLLNPFFRQAYAAYAVYYYYSLGYSDAETTLDGDVQHQRQGNVNLGDSSKNISLQDSRSKTASAYGMAEGYFASFVNNFWLANKAKYSCLPPEKNCSPKGACYSCHNDSLSNLQNQLSRKRYPRTIVI